MVVMTEKISATSPQARGKHKTS